MSIMSCLHRFRADATGHTTLETTLLLTLVVLPLGMGTLGAVEAIAGWLRVVAQALALPLP